MPERGHLPEQWGRLLPPGVSVEQISSDMYDDGQGCSFLIEQNEKEIFISFYFQDDEKSWVMLQFYEHAFPPDMTGFDEFALYDLPKLLRPDTDDRSYPRKKASITVIADGVEFKASPKSKKYYLDELMDKIGDKKVQQVIYEFPLRNKKNSETVCVGYNNPADNDMACISVTLPLFYRGLIDQSFMRTFLVEYDDSDKTCSNIANSIQIICDYLNI
jgi:hypothetical protein